jgi:hypothetical protein
MICSAKPVLTNDLYIVQKKEFSITCYTPMCDMFDERPSIIIRDKLFFSPERMLYKDYYCKGSVGKNISAHRSEGA